MKKIIVLLILSFLLTSCFGEKDEIVENKKEVKTENKENIKTFKNPKNDLEKQIDIRESKLIKNKNELLDLAKAYLNYGNSYYNEKTFANKALNILNKMNSEFIVEYLKGYAYEIQTEYEKALNQYNKALAFVNITDEEKVNALNQKGHIYDLQGKMKEANKYYLMAEKILQDNPKTLLNRGRYEFRVYNFKKSKDYFKNTLKNTNDNFLKSELYYNLSLINQALYEMDNAIKNANLGIKFNKDYPNNYLSLGKSYLMKDKEFEHKAIKPLKKSIELYKNNSTAYKYLGIYYYKNNNFKKAIENFKKQVETSQKDILLMANNKEELRISGEFDLARSYAFIGDVNNSIIYLKKVLNGKNKLYYELFLLEYVDNNGSFNNLLNNKVFKDSVKTIILKYNQSKNEKNN